MKQSNDLIGARSFPGIKYASLLFATLLLVFACSNEKKSSKETSSVEEKARATGDEVLKTLGGNAITMELHKSGSGFQPEALHDISKVPHYLQLSNQGVAAANLGVYMSDLGYLTDFDQRAEVKRYFDGCLVLANHIGMGEQFSHAIELRFSEIITGNEDLKISLDRLFEKTSNTAQGDEFKRMHAAALTGYYIEELYHLVTIEQSNEYSSELRMKALQTLIRQRPSMDNLVSYFDHLKLKPEGIILYQEFLKLQTSYLSLDANRLQGETDPAVVMVDKNLQDIISSIVRIRNSMTEL